MLNQYTTEIRVLQLNANRSERAHGYLTTLAARRKADVLLVSEPNKALIAKGGWISDAEKLATIKVLNPKRVVCLSAGSFRGCAWIELRDLVIASVYTSPNEPIQRFEDTLLGLQNLKRSKRKGVLICGDFNAKAPAWNPGRANARGNCLADWMAGEDLLVMNDGFTPTWRREDSKSVLDLTIATDGVARRIRDWLVIDEFVLSDHSAIYFRVEGVAGLTDWSADVSWKFNSERKEAVEMAISFAFAEDSPRTPEQLSRALQRACEMTLERRKDSRRRVYWWGPEIAGLHSAAVKARRVALRLRAYAAPRREELIRVSREAKKSLRRAIFRSKKAKWEELCSDLDRDIWGRAYKLVRKKFGIPKPTLPLELVERCVDKLFPTVGGFTNVTASFDEPVCGFSKEEVVLAARKLGNKRSPGPDGVPPEVVKIAAKTETEQLRMVFNGLLESGCFPACWKRARLVLLLKPGKSATDPSGYRPLCLLDAVGKLYEQLLLTRLQDELEDKMALSGKQYGFRKGRSTVDAIVRVHRATERLAAGTRRTQQIPAVILLDVRNAFNTVRWDVVLRALEAAQIEPYLRNVLASYLSERLLLYNGNGERWLSCGVPQGSKLGPTLWNVAYDGVLRLHYPVGVECTGYADDLALVVAARNSADVRIKAEKAISMVAGWMRERGLELASEKTELIIMTGRRANVTVEICVDGFVIKPSKTAKYLGVLLDKNRRFIRHAEAAAEKAMKTALTVARVMRNIRGPRNSKRKLLATVVSSVALYAVPAWHGALAFHKACEALERVRRQSALRVISAYRTVSREAAFVIAGFLPMKQLADLRVAKAAGLPREGAADLAWQKWLSKLSATGKAEWTRRLILDPRKWAERKFGEVDYWTTQFLSGHGGVRCFLARINKHPTGLCPVCNVAESMEHVFFYCGQWDVQRRKCWTELGGPQSVGTIVRTMLEEETKWNAVRIFIRTVLQEINV